MNELNCLGLDSTEADPETRTWKVAPSSICMEVGKEETHLHPHQFHLVFGHLNTSGHTFTYETICFLRTRRKRLFSSFAVRHQMHFLLNTHCSKISGF